MKTTLLCLIVSLSFTKTEAQIIFCPAGAEWHYLFKYYFGSYANEQIKYSGDSLLNNTVVKKLVHKRFYPACNNNAASPNSPNVVTLIKQSGDTVFFRSALTQHTWQILYNFSAQPGQIWQTTYYQDNGIGYLVTNTITVDSVRNVSINSISHRRLYVKENFDPNSPYAPSTFIITERFGSEFLFHFTNSFVSSCDGDFFNINLCYSDNSFGIKQFTDLACNAENPLGIPEVSDQRNAIRFYPNPVKDRISIEPYTQLTNAELIVTNIYGIQVIKTNLLNNETDLTGLAPGIYFLLIFEQGQHIATQKIIKE
jgi:hypothetical protein